MKRPLVITDCDEVLLHMVRHFRDWLAAEHAIDVLGQGRRQEASVRRAIIEDGLQLGAIPAREPALQPERTLR